MFSDLQLSKDTEMILNELFKRKLKMDKLKEVMVILAFANVILLFILFSFIYKLGLSVTFDPLSILSYITGNKVTFFIMLIAVSSFIYSSSLSNQHKKAKKKFENLREETITVLLTEWELTEQSYKKDIISERLEQKGINLRYIH